MVFRRWGSQSLSHIRCIFSSPDSSGDIPIYQLENGGDWTLNTDFEELYAQQHDLLNPDIWKYYYRPAFLEQANSARYYRLLNLPDSSEPLCAPRSHRGVGHFNKLPRWVAHVLLTARRQQTLPWETLHELVLSTLQKSIS